MFEPSHLFVIAVEDFEKARLRAGGSLGATSREGEEAMFKLG